VHWWGRRFRLPIPLATDSLTAPDPRGSPPSRAAF
jgi:hypothetical protein